MDIFTEFPDFSQFLDVYIAKIDFRTIKNTKN